LVVRHNTTRNVGTARHNHTTVEREVRHVPRRPVETVINIVVRNYRMTSGPARNEAPRVRVYEVPLPSAETPRPRRYETSRSRRYEAPCVRGRYGCRVSLSARG
jgi:hypothetical protein